MKRVLVTGGTGFIGTYVADQLRKHPGLTVATLGQGEFAGMRLGQARTLPQMLCDHPRFDVVVHLAAYIGNSCEDIRTANFHGIHDILDYCNSNKVDSLVHLSRSFEVKRGGGDFSSSRLGSLYEYSKRYAELVLHERSSVPTRILRITAPVWHSMPRERYLSQILLSIAGNSPIKIYGQGRRRQNYVRLDDIGKAVLSAINDTVSTNVQNYWVVGPENLTDYELARTVCERLGVPFKYEFVSPPAGQVLDESDYGVEREGYKDPFLPIISRAIDEEFLRAHLNVISSGVS